MAAPARRRSGDKVEPKQLTASAARIDKARGSIAQRDLGKRSDWQREAWDYYESVPELMGGINYVGNQMSKLRVFVATPDPDNVDADPIDIDDDRSPIPDQWRTLAKQELEKLQSPQGGRVDLLRTQSINTDLVGECFLLGELWTDPVSKATTESWDIRSISELEVQDQGIDSTTGEARFKIIVKDHPEDQKGRELDPNTTAVIRIWNRSPRWAQMADSNVRGLRTECQALQVLSQLVIADANSQMNAGILTIPSELSFGSDDDNTDDAEDPESDPFMDQLDEAVTEPIEDPSSASSVTPLVLRGEKEYLGDDSIRHITFNKATDTNLDSRIEERVLRLARGLDLPVEVIEGHQKTTFANAKQIDADTWAKYLEPRAKRLVTSWTIGYLIPNLLDAKCPPEIASLIMVWYDPAGVIGGPDQATAADSALEKNAISLRAYRKATGWSETDAPDPIELLIRLALNQKVVPPQFFEFLLKLIDPAVEPTELPGGSPQAAMDTLAQMLGLPVRELPPVDKQVTAIAASGHAVTASKVGKKLLSIDQSLRTRVTSAADSAMARALDKAGNKLRGQVPKGVAAMIPPGTPGRYVANLLGPTVVGDSVRRLAAVNDLFGGSWDELKEQFMTWAGNAQSQALDQVSKLASGLSTEERASLKLKMADDLDTGWKWFEHSLSVVAEARLFSPDPTAPDVGEFDPTSSVPTGMIRRAMSIAGGRLDLATDVTEDVLSAGAWVVLDPAQATNPQGGVATGDNVQDGIATAGASVGGFWWEYGDAFRLNSFEPHEELDGVNFENFDDPVLANSYGFPEVDFFIPGDHAGCGCDFGLTINDPGPAPEGD